jgi:hypothetical protein
MVAFIPLSGNATAKGGPVSLKDSYFPVTLVTTLVCPLPTLLFIDYEFFLWGFAYGMLDVLNKVNDP